MPSQKLTTFKTSTAVPAALGTAVLTGDTRAFARAAVLGNAGTDMDISPDLTCRIETGETNKASAYDTNDVLTATGRLDFLVKQLGSVGTDFMGGYVRMPAAAVTGLAVYIVPGGIAINEDFGSGAEVTVASDGRRDTDITQMVHGFAEMIAGNKLNVFYEGIQVVKDYSIVRAHDGADKVGIVGFVQGTAADNVGFGLRGFGWQPLMQEKLWDDGVTDGTILPGGPWDHDDGVWNSPGSNAGIKVTGTRNLEFVFDTSVLEAAGYAEADSPVVRFFKNGKTEADAMPFGDEGRIQLVPVAAADGGKFIASLYPGLMRVNGAGAEDVAGTIPAQLDPTETNTFYWVFEAQGGGQHGWTKPMPQAVYNYSVKIDSDGTFLTPDAHDKTIMVTSDSIFALAANVRGDGTGGPEINNSATLSSAWTMVNDLEAEFGIKIGLSVDGHGGRGYDQAGNAGDDIPAYNVSADLKNSAVTKDSTPEPDLHINTLDHNGSYIEQDVLDAHGLTRSLWATTHYLYVSSANPSNSSRIELEDAVNTLVGGGDTAISYLENTTNFTADSNDGVHPGIGGTADFKEFVRDYIITNNLLDVADPGEIISVSVSPSSATLRPNATQQFTATVNGGDPFNDEVYWSVSPPSSGHITQGGLFTALPNPADSTPVVTATSKADPTKTDTANVTYSGFPLITGPTKTIESTWEYGVYLGIADGAANSDVWGLNGGMVESIAWEAGMEGNRLYLQTSPNNSDWTSNSDFATNDGNAGSYTFASPISAAFVRVRSQATGSGQNQTGAAVVLLNCKGPDWQEFPD